MSHIQGLITDEELLLLLDLNTAKNPEFSYDIYDRFDLDEIDEAECKAEFRIEKRDIRLLADALGMPATLKCPQRTVAGGIEGLCMLLKRTSFPCRYSDMIWKASSHTQYGHQPSCGLYLSSSRSQNHSME